MIAFLFLFFLASFLFRSSSSFIGCSFLSVYLIRLAFIALSVRHLYRTSYNARAGDELTAMALVNYLNAALPADKHEEFDLPEVTKAVAGALRERGVVRLEGDVVRLVG